MQKQLLITFDYELYLGNRSGNINDCMIAPTNKLINVMGKYGIRAVFFVDTTYLLRLHEQSSASQACQKDFEIIADQLRELVRVGHYVFPHIHPHWLDAEYMSKSNQWKLNNTRKYLFKNITTEERTQVFDGSVNILKSILNTEFPDYKIDAFRAGGWGIQPFSNFIPYFEKHQFKYEFSVLGGFYQFTDAQFFDFSNAPSKPIYRFKDDVCLEVQNGPYTQYNISSINISTGISLLNKIWIKTQSRVFKDDTFHKGEGQPSKVVSNTNPASTDGKDLSSTGWERVAVELLTSIKMKSYLDFLEINRYMHFISHPKMVTNHNLSVFDKFLKKVFDKYPINTDFRMMFPE